MHLQDLLNYVEENASDVNDLASVDKIRKSQRHDPYRTLLVKELRQKYKDQAVEAQRGNEFDEAMS